MPEVPQIPQLAAADPLICEMCEASANDVKWAMDKKIIKPPLPGHTVPVVERIPCGPGCFKCFNTKEIRRSAFCLR